MNERHEITKEDLIRWEQLAWNVASELATGDDAQVLTIIETGLAQAYWAGKRETPAPLEPLLAKVAESWIRTGQAGEGLRNDEYSVKHREIVMGIYGYCGKTIKDYLAYSAAGDPEQAK